MVVASAKASPRMAWMSLARSSMDCSAHWGSSASSVGLPLGHCAREASNEWPLALANEVATCESTATLDFHPSRVGCGMRYRKRVTLGGLANGGDKAFVDGIGRFRAPMTPWLSRKAVWAVNVFSVWREIRLGSHIVRW